MASFVTGVALLLLLRTPLDEGASLTLIPQTVAMKGDAIDGPLQVSCRPPAASQIASVSSLTIQRFTAASGYSTHQDLATATDSIEGGDARNLANLTGSSVSGSVSEMFVNFTLSSPSCTDQGMYKCIASYIERGGTMTNTTNDQRNFTINALPGNVAMTISPVTSEKNFHLYTRIELKCEGFVGGQDSGVEWIWKYNDFDAEDTPDYTPRTDIRNDPSTTSTTLPCQRRQVSRLTRRVTLQDQGREYSCRVCRDGSCSNAPFITIGKINETGATSPPPDTTSSVSTTTATTTPPQTTTPAEGGIDFLSIGIGVGVTVAVVVVVVVVLVLCLWLRRWKCPCARSEQKEHVRRSDIQAQDNPYYTQDRPDDSELQANGDYLEPSAICRDSQFNPYDTLQEDYETLDKAELGHSSSYAELNEFSSSPDPNEYKNTGM